MLFQKKIKNSINNDDYFKLRQSRAKREGNIRYVLYNVNKSKNNNQNSYNINKYPNNSNTSILSNDISAQNYIKKYKDRIINREKIVEENYKNFNKYRNHENNKLNLKKLNGYKIPIRNIGLNIFKKDGNRIYKSLSNDNVFQKSFYLSQNMDNNIKINKSINNPNKLFKSQYNNNKYFNKMRTDITDNSIIEINNNKEGFVDYKNKILEIQNENRKISEEKKNLKENNLYNSLLEEQNKINRENIYFNNLITQDLIGKRNFKIKYRQLLDEQVRNNLNDKLMNESLTYNDLIKNQTNMSPEKFKTEKKNFNKNSLIEINPYKHRNYYLGDSQLRHNIITNPVSLFKINKYFFQKNDVDELNY